MSYIIKKIFLHKYIGILIAISILMHIRWIIGENFFGSDLMYFHPDMLHTLPFSQTWNSGWGIAGSINDQLWRLPYSILYGLIGDSNIAVKLLVFIPYILLLPISIYTFLSLFFSHANSRFFGSLFFMSSTYFLAINSQGHIHLSIATCLLLLSWYFYQVFLKKGNFQGLVNTILLLTLCGIYDLRILYIGIFVLFFWTIAQYKDVIYSKEKILFIIGGGMLFLGIQMFWVYPTLHMGLGTSMERSIFGNGFWSFHHAYTLYHPFWTIGKEVSWFQVQNIPAYHFLIPLGVFWSFVHHKKNIFMNYFFILFLVGILLAKGNNEPFGFIYTWLYENLPGFKAFREPTKFYILGTIASTYFITLLIDTSIRKKILKISIILVFVLSTSSLILGTAGNVYTENPPQKNDTIITGFLEKDDNYHRVLWIPGSQAYSYYSNRHPKVKSMLQSPFPRFEGSIYSDDATRFKDIISDTSTQAIIDNMSIKYIVVAPGDTEENRNYGWYSNLSPEILTSSIATSLDVEDITPSGSTATIYQNNNYLPHIFSTKTHTHFTQLNQTKYEITLKGLQDTTNIHFLEAFHPGWKLYVYSGEHTCPSNKTHKSKITDTIYSIECIKDIDLFSFSILQSFSSPKIEKSTKRYKGYAQTWEVEDTYIKQLGENYYTVNEDGSINISFILHFEPEKYLYRGGAISLLSLIILITSGYLFRRKVFLN